jgi:hypothetical protein
MNDKKTHAYTVLYTATRRESMAVVTTDAADAERMVREELSKQEVSFTNLVVLAGYDGNSY